MRLLLGYNFNVLLVIIIRLVTVIAQGTRGNCRASFSLEIKVCENITTCDDNAIVVGNDLTFKVYIRNRCTTSATGASVTATWQVGTKVRVFLATDADQGLFNYSVVRFTRYEPAPLFRSTFALTANDALFSTPCADESCGIITLHEALDLPADPDAIVLIGTFHATAIALPPLERGYHALYSIAETEKNGLVINDDVCRLGITGGAAGSTVAVFAATTTTTTLTGTTSSATSSVTSTTLTTTTVKATCNSIPYTSTMCSTGLLADNQSTTKCTGNPCVDGAADDLLCCKAIATCESLPYIAAMCSSGLLADNQAGTQCTGNPCVDGAADDVLCCKDRATCDSLPYTAAMCSSGLLADNQELTQCTGNPCLDASFDDALCCKESSTTTFSTSTPTTSTTSTSTTSTSSTTTTSTTTTARPTVTATITVSTTTTTTTSTCSQLKMMPLVVNCRGETRTMYIDPEGKNHMVHNATFPVDLSGNNVVLHLDVGGSTDPHLMDLSSGECLVGQGDNCAFQCGKLVAAAASESSQTAVVVGLIGILASLMLCAFCCLGYVLAMRRQTQTKQIEQVDIDISKTTVEVKESPQVVYYPAPQVVQPPPPPPASPLPVQILQESRRVIIPDRREQMMEERDEKLVAVVETSELEICGNNVECNWPVGGARQQPTNEIVLNSQTGSNGTQVFSGAGPNGARVVTVTAENDGWIPGYGQGISSDRYLADGYGQGNLARGGLYAVDGYGQSGHYATSLPSESVGSGRGLHSNTLYVDGARSNNPQSGRQYVETVRPISPSSGRNVLSAEDAWKYDTGNTRVIQATSPMSSHGHNRSLQPQSFHTGGATRI